MFIEMFSDTAEGNDNQTLKIQEFCIIIIVVWVFFFISLYHRAFLRLFFVIYRAIATRNRVQRQIPDVSNFQRRLADLSNLYPSNSSRHVRSSGLEYSMVQALPMSQFKKNEVEQKLSDVDCAICLGEFEEGEWVKHLPICTHSFHVSCIDKWFQSHSNCPLCRCCVIQDHLSTSEDIFYSL
jgi:hypothetical protein